MLTLAYFDAGSGSLIVSAIAAGGAGAVVAAKAGMHRFKRPFGRKPETVVRDADADEPETQATERGVVTEES
jgi:hypothetical protein